MVARHGKEGIMTVDDLHSLLLGYIAGMLTILTWFTL